MTDLFTPMTLGDYQLPNRIIMAPMTRGRAVDNAVPNDLIAEYYAQRASAGLIITEATSVAQNGIGWLNTPGMFNDEQQAGWKTVADKVHENGGRIFVQLWHMGSVVHPDFLPEGELPVSSSPVKAQGMLPTPKGRDRELATPRELTTDEVKQMVQNFISSARRAVDAGLDGIEIHAANGFLIDQFIRDSANKRTDEYGGSTENRLRFMMEIVEGTVKEIGAGRVGIRLSPTNKVWGIADSDYKNTFSAAVEKLNAYNLAYLHILEPKPELNLPMETIDYISPDLRKIYNGTLIMNAGYTRETGNAAIKNSEADAIAFGTPFIGNPDLVERYKQNAPLNEPKPDFFYTGGEQGFTDYPAL